MLIKKANVAILISDTTEFKMKAFSRIKDILCR